MKEYETRNLLHYIYEGSDNYNQHAWVTRMARMAYTDYGADWVINNDADEFWWPVHGNLKETFEALPEDVNIVEAERHNFIVVDNKDEPFWASMVYCERTSLNALGKPLPSKVAHRGCAGVKVSQGNHAVEGVAVLRTVAGLIEIMHYPVRNYRQIENKIALGGAAYERNRELPESAGRTWRKLYDDFLVEGSLKRYFDNEVHDKHRLEERFNAGEILKDTRIRDFLGAC